MRVTLDKLQGIRGDLVRNHDNWQDWKLQQLVETLEKQTVRNPTPLSDKRNSEKVIAIAKVARLNKLPTCERVYYKKPDHISSDCKTAKTVTERRKILRDKKLCFNCTEAKHRAAECRSSKTCLKCKNKHHTSISDKLADSKSEPMLVTTETNVTYPVAIRKVNNVKCRALLDTGCGGSYIPESLIDLLKINPVKKESKTIKKLTNSTS